MISKVPTTPTSSRLPENVPETPVPYKVPLHPREEAPVGRLSGAGSSKPEAEPSI